MLGAVAQQTQFNNCDDNLHIEKKNIHKHDKCNIKSLRWVVFATSQATPHR